ncbi:hypothetical protein VaNZ11_007151, partial [Volvox africanus]
MSVRGKEFPSLVQEAGHGYKLRLLVPGPDGRERSVYIPPPQDIVADDTDLWPSWCFQLLLVASEYVAALHEFMTWSFPDEWASRKAQVAGYARQLIRNISLVPQPPLWQQQQQQQQQEDEDGSAYRVWAAFTHCYFHGLQKPADGNRTATQPSPGEHSEASRWLHRLVGNRGWQEEGPVHSAAARWVGATLLRLQPLFPDVAAVSAGEWAARMEQQRGVAAALRSVATRGDKNVQGRYVPVYPYRMTGTWSENRFKLTMKGHAGPRSVKGSCGVPPNFGQTSNCALGYLVLADVTEAFTTAFEEAARSSWLAGQEALQRHIIQDFYSSVLSSDTVGFKSDYVPYGYPSYLVTCVLGWKLVLEQLPLWLAAAAAAAGAAGLMVGEGTQLELMMPLQRNQHQMQCQMHLSPLPLPLPQQQHHHHHQQQQQQQLAQVVQLHHDMHQHQQQGSYPLQGLEGQAGLPVLYPPAPGANPHNQEQLHHHRPPQHQPPHHHHQQQYMLACWPPQTVVSDSVGVGVGVGGAPQGPPFARNSLTCEAPGVRPDLTSQAAVVVAQGSGSPCSSPSLCPPGSAPAAVSPFVALQQQQQQQQQGGPAALQYLSPPVPSPLLGNLEAAENLLHPPHPPRHHHQQQQQHPPLLSPIPPPAYPSLHLGGGGAAAAGPSTAVGGVAAEVEVTSGLSNMSLDGPMAPFGDETLKLIGEDFAKTEPGGPPPPPLTDVAPLTVGKGQGAGAAAVGALRNAPCGAPELVCFPGQVGGNGHFPRLPETVSGNVLVPTRTITTVLQVPKQYVPPTPPPPPLTPPNQPPVAASTAVGHVGSAAGPQAAAPKGGDEDDRDG